MQKFQVEITRTIELIVHEETEAFKNAFEDFKSVIQDGDEDQMIQYVASQVLKHGYRRMIEGVGYVSCNGNLTNMKLYCGIDVVDDDPFENVEIL